VLKRSVVKKALEYAETLGGNSLDAVITSRERVRIDEVPFGKIERDSEFLICVKLSLARAEK
jgi:hypothetical protein